jgi:glycosyltransferase involved in cell wall biosynthesis
MRLAVVSTPFVSVPPKTYGGTELVVHELVEGLSARGHQVTLFATGDSLTSARLRAIYDEPCWPPELMQDINHVSWAMACIAREPFDLIHAHSAVALAFARLIPDIPIVYTLHHVRDEPLTTFYQNFPESYYVAISEDQARREEPLPRLTVIHHGLNPEHYQWQERAADYVCFIGRFSEIKGPHTAMDAAEIAGVPIQVAGEAHPPDREFAEREVFPRMQKPHVSYVGCIGMEEKVPFFRDARALLVPIEWNEPFGLVMIEAMLSGCPIVAFPRGSVPELVDEGITGFIVRDRAEMAELIRPGGALDDHDRRRCRQRAVERFASSRMVERHERLFQRILNSTAQQRDWRHQEGGSAGDSQFSPSQGNRESV